jgi:hypothetical protein
MWGSNLNFSNWKGEAEKWEPGKVVQGPALASEPEFLSFFFFFKWKQDYGTLSPTEGIFHLLLSDWVLVIYMLS